MKAEIDKAIKNLTSQAYGEHADSSDALRYSQAALNLAHVKTMLAQADNADNEMNASEALYGFMGWLTSRDEITPEFSAKHDASEAAQLIAEFSKENKLTDPRAGWETNLIHPSGECSFKG